MPLFPLISAASLPPITAPWAVLQTLLVAAAAFAALAVAVSLLRYQNLVREARDQADEGLDHENLLLLLAEAQATEECFSVIRLAPEADRAGDLIRELRPCLRAADQLWKTRGGEVVILLPKTEAANVPYITKRLKTRIAGIAPQGVFSAAGFPSDVASEPPADSKTPRLQTAALLWKKLSTPALSGHDGWNFPEDPPPWDMAIAPGQEAFLDPETGLLPVPRTHNALAKDLAGHRRRNKPASLLVFAVDELDSYPEEQRIPVLQAAGREIMRACRETDLVGGIENFEIVISMPGPLEQTRNAARRICEGPRETTEKIRFTLSCGIAAWPAHGESPARLLQRARTALNTARTRGRGSCLIFENSMLPNPHRPSSSSVENAENF